MPARRRDANEDGIVVALRDVGASVCRLYDTGAPDLLVGYHGDTYLLEVKAPMGPRGGLSKHRECDGGIGDMTRAQVAWWKDWTGTAPMIVRSAEDALRAIGAA